MRIPSSISATLAILALTACAASSRPASFTATKPPTDTAHAEDVPHAGTPTAPVTTQAPAPVANTPVPATATKATPVGTHTQPVAPEANPQAASVAEALRTKRHPERLSPLVKPKSFDPVAYAHDKTPYLSVTEPGRVFDTKAPATDVPVLTPVGATAAACESGGTVRLAVQAIANSPVSWLSTDLGSFENQLVSMTNEAGADGVAVALFTATAGVAGRVQVLAGSPVCSGQVRFIIDVNATTIIPSPVANAPSPTPAPGH